MEKVIVLTTGTGKNSLLADDFYLGCGGFRQFLTLRQASDPAHFDISMLERELSDQTVFLLAPCDAGQVDDSPMQLFERRVLESALARKAPCGLLVTRLAYCMAAHLKALGPQISVIVSPDNDVTGGLESIYPKVALHDIPSTFNIPGIVSRILDGRCAA